MRLLFPYGAWYAMAAWSAFGAVSAGLRGDFPYAALDGAVAVAITALAVRSRVRLARSGERALRAELERLVDERAGSGAAAWLNRDAHLLFTADRDRLAGMRQRTLMVLDEDLLRDVQDARDAGGGKVAATFTAFQVHPALARVIRRTDGMTALVTGADIEDAHPGHREPWYRGMAGTVRTLRSGMAFADAGELAEVLARFREAEPVGPDGA